MKTSPLTMIFATIGGLAVLAMFMFFIMVTVSLGQIGEIARSNMPKLSHADYKLGVVEIKGPLLDAKKPLKHLKIFAEDPSIKGILVRIDSPGGSVVPAQEIYRLIQKIKQNKKVVASLGNVAASGGYYIASGADYIVANPGTLTGSIGVILQNLNIKDVLGLVHLKSVVMKSGKYKDILSPLREMLTDEKELVQNVLDDVHLQFKNDVAKGRKLPLSEIDKIADGRIFTGSQALQFKLVDELGGLDEGAKYIAKESKLEGQYELIYPKKSPINKLEELIGQMESMLDIAEIASWKREGL